VALSHESQWTGLMLIKVPVMFDPGRDICRNKLLLS
jgi:hypothetical protein